jgi:hypothetical protein
MTDLNINVVAHELDPSKRYIIEVRQGDLTMEAVDELRKALAKVGVMTLLVVSTTGEAIKVNTVPEEVN